MSHKWLEWAKRIQALSQSGLTFSKDVFDIERYTELREISAEIMAEYSELELEKVQEFFCNDQGYQTPKVDVRGVVFKGNQILMVREIIDDKWSLPGGFCDIELSPAENIVKEIKEESGYDVVPIKLLALFDMNKHNHPPQPFHYYKLFFQCEIVDGHANIGVETKDIQFFSEDNLPILSMDRNTDAQIKAMFQFLNDPNRNTLFD